MIKVANLLKKGFTYFDMQIKRDDRVIATFTVGSDNSYAFYPVSAIRVFDVPEEPGRHEYSVEARLGSGKGNLYVTRARLVAHEIGT